MNEWDKETLRKFITYAHNKQILNCDNCPAREKCQIGNPKKPDCKNLLLDAYLHKNKKPRIVTDEMRERAEKLKVSTWHITDPKGDEFDFTFRQLCTYFGIKYISMYKRVVDEGKDVLVALDECRNNPKTWGVTYSKGTLAKGVFEDGVPVGKENSAE